MTSISCRSTPIIGENKCASCPNGHGECRLDIARVYEEEWGK